MISAKTYMLGIAAIMVSALIKAQTLETLQLDEAIAIAVENNYGIKAIKTDVEVAKNNNTLGNAGLLPSVGINAGYDLSFDNLDLTIANFANDGQGNRNISENGVQSYNIHGSVDVTYPIIRGVRGQYLLDQLGYLETIGNKQLELEVELLTVNVTTSYLDIARRFYLTEIAQEGVVISLERYQRAKNAFEFGNSNRLEILQAEVDLKNDSLALKQSQLQYENSKRNLNALLSRKPNESITVSNQIKITEMLPDIETLVSESLENNTRLHLLKSGIDISESNISIAKASRFPELNVFASYRYLESDTEVGQLLNIQRTGPLVGISLRQNIFNGSNVKRQITNTKLEKEKQDYQYEDAKIQLETEITNGYNEYLNNLEQLRIAKENVGTTERNYERASSEYKNGQINATALREVNLNLIRAKNLIVDFSYLVRVSEIRLLQLTGKL
ncbi:TolC family protein [uncultured Aquimarina sp.]|uniref:TolC family protein n=1 Tax=uncultured Aquimarina sp. TaxID=575652 RepID=UPI00262028DA|nr:TolC family protein [uncultured Aquimarina sp.]